ncbi:MAG: hypothetical protein JWO05_656 [Gemmatimonadetes bacterium]|nr:hypothetical protein [Gemmatimonadota bacterium]
MGGFRSLVTEHVVLKATAFLVAVMLWFIVTVKEPAEDDVAVRLIMPGDSTVQLRGARPKVRVLVAARGGDILKLHGTPPTLRLRVPADPPDSMVVELRPGDVDLPAGIEGTVRDIYPKSVTLRFSDTAERLLPVRAALDVAPSLPVGGVSFDFAPESVRVRGPRRLVVRTRGVYTAHVSVLALDTAAQQVPLDTERHSGLTLLPPRVQVRVRRLHPAP